MEPQAETTLIELIRYNNWANAQVIAACQALGPGQLAAAMPGAFGDIRATLEHLIHAEASYIGRITGNRPQPPFHWGEQAPLEAVAAFAARVAEALLDTVRRTPPTYLVHEEEDGNTIDYHARLLFIQVINHGVEHRTNITTILSSLGLAAPEVDGWGYLFSHPDRFALQESSAGTGSAG